MGDNLPVDPDLGATPAPLLGPRAIVAVFVGGAVGALARHALGQWLDGHGTVPWGTFITNIGGAIALGLLLESLLLAGPDTGVRRDLRLGLGTGVLGGFTTYSTLAVQTHDLLAESVVVGIAYALGTVALGLLGALAGVRAARWLRGVVVNGRAA